MCFGSCRVTCDNCKPLLVFKQCKQCGAPFTEEMKDAARADWAAKAAERAGEQASKR